jgi:DNA-binding IclR family transcriptional regulator
MPLICDDAAVTDTSTTPQRSGAQAVERALAVLHTVETSDHGLGITELAHHAGLTVSTTHRLARALTEDGLLIQDPRTERYQLGPALIMLGKKAEQRLGYRQALPLLEELSSATGESINLGVRVGNQVRVVLDVVSPQPLRFAQTPGTRVPLHASAMGKCLLATSGDIDTQVDQLGELPQATHRTITDHDQLRRELQLVRQRGWALNDEERNPGVRAIAAPVLHTDGHVLAAIAVQGPTIRITNDRLPQLAALLNKTAHQIAPLLMTSQEDPR